MGKVGDGRTWGWLSHRGTEVKRQPLYNCTYWHRSYQTVQRGQSTVLEIKISNFFFYFHFKHPIMSSVWLQNFEMIQSSLWLTNCDVLVNARISILWRLIPRTKIIALIMYLKKSIWSTEENDTKKKGKSDWGQKHS